MPKVRDSLSTIEEEHQEYDVPKNIIAAIKDTFDEDIDDDPIAHNSEENLYENQAYVIDSGKKDSNAIYANDSALTEFSVSTHSTDDRSSGYRSSSSPSIQSEELYVNESAIGSMEDTTPSPDMALPSSHCKEIGVGTSGSLPKPEKSKKSKKKEKESKREKERAQAEAIDQEILGKKASLERPKSKAPKPPKTYFNEDPKKIEVPQVNTEERKKHFLQSIENKEPIKKPVTNNNDTIDKKNSQKDRSVDVYHETVRQRVTRNTEAVKDVFNDESHHGTHKKTKKKPRTSSTSQKDINDEELPSVKELRSKFEVVDKSKIMEEQPAKKSGGKMKGKIDFKKGFNVMSSLTRRSASSVSKSMQNLTMASDNRKTNVEEMEFSHFTFAEENETRDDTKVVAEEPLQVPAMDPQPLAEPLYVNIEPKRNSIKKKKDHLQEDMKEVENIEENPPQPIQVQHRARNGGESSAANKLLQSALEEEPQDELALIGPWNPYKTVAHLYKLQDIKETNESSCHAEEMEGYLERLPPGKKKSTIWNSWKRQYFVAKSGLLLIFGDSSRSVVMDRIELFGGRVDYMESTMLGIQDRRGHYVVLRLKDSEDADKWHSALASHVSHDLAQSFVTPSPLDPGLFKQILVVDFGGCSVRAGIVSSMPTLPQLFFPSVMAIGKNHEDEKYFGMDAFAPEVRSRCNLVHPFAPSSNVDKYTVNQVIHHLLDSNLSHSINIDTRNFFRLLFKASLKRFSKT